MLPPPPPIPNKNLSLSLSSTLSHTHTLLGAELKMKQKFHTVGVLLLFLVFLIIINTSAASTRKLASKQGETNININKSVFATEKIESFTDLMGLEKCENEEEEECLSRRALAEAHLDYIYTQDHKP